jgi:hypothetical protein
MTSSRDEYNLDSPIAVSNFQSFDDSTPLENRRRAYNHIYKILSERTDLLNYNGKKTIDLRLIISKKIEDSMQYEAIEGFRLFFYNMKSEEELDAAVKELTIYKKYEIAINDDSIKEVDEKMILTPIFFQIQTD